MNKEQFVDLAKPSNEGMIPTVKSLFQRKLQEQRLSTMLISNMSMRYAHTSL